MGIEAPIEKRALERDRKHHPLIADTEIVAPLVFASGKGSELAFELFPEFVNQGERKDSVNLKPAFRFEPLRERHDAVL